MTTTKTRILIYIAIAVAATVIIGYFVVSAINKSNNSPEKLLSLGEKYLLDLDYEQALVQFLKVIEIEPMNERAYLAAAEAYIGLGQMDKAIEILEKGLLALPDSAVIKARLEELSPLPEPLPVESAPISEAEPASEVKPVNLTGKEPFMLKDLEDWGAPIGMPLADIVKRFDCSKDQIQRMIDSHDYNNREFYFGSINNDSSPYDVSVEGDSINNISLNSVIIPSYRDSAGIGPRGLRIGMTLEEVINLFACTNPNLIEFAPNPTFEAFMDIADTHYLADVYGNLEFKFTGKEALFSHSARVFVNTNTQHANYGYNIRYRLWETSETLSTKAETYIDIYFGDDGIVDEISIYYPLSY